MPRRTRHDIQVVMVSPFNMLSFEALVCLFAGSLLGLAEMNWEFRTLGVVVTAFIAVDIARRIERSIWIKLAVAAGAIGILLLVTWHPIWVDFHESFPEATGEAVLARIVEFGALAGALIAAYVFLIRPSRREGYRVLPAQVVAFGACVMAFGLLTVGIGLIWQFQQNWAAGIKPSGAPVFSLIHPQILPATTPALAAPKQTAPTPYFSGYNLTEDGVKALADELFKIRDGISKHIDLERMSTDPTSGGLASNIGRACDQAGIDCPVNFVHPNSPTDRGPMIFVGDPKNPPEAAEKLRAAFLNLGIDIPFVARPGFEAPRFALFLAPAP